MVLPRFPLGPHSASPRPVILLRPVIARGRAAAAQRSILPIPIPIISFSSISHDTTAAELEAFAWQAGRAFNELAPHNDPVARRADIAAASAEACALLDALGGSVWLWGIELLDVLALPYRWRRSTIHEHRLPGPDTPDFGAP
jgi:hypothetical protein